MKIGLPFWQAKTPLILAFVLCLGAISYAQAQPQYQLEWQDRTAEETADGNLVETPPKVAINGLGLRAFSEYQRIQFVQTIPFQSAVELETLHVFKVWLGGATQGEQLMLVVTAPSGIEVVGPHPQDFETLNITPPQGDNGPIFELIGADPNTPLARIEYFGGRLIELPSN